MKITENSASQIAAQEDKTKAQIYYLTLATITIIPSVYLSIRVGIIFLFLVFPGAFFISSLFYSKSRMLIVDKEKGRLTYSSKLLIFPSTVQSYPLDQIKEVDVNTQWNTQPTYVSNRGLAIVQFTLQDGSKVSTFREACFPNISAPVRIPEMIVILAQSVARLLNVPFRYTGEFLPTAQKESPKELLHN